jgi:hypothetical protein
MARWFFVILLALLLISWLMPWLNKIGLGRLPGDLRFRLFGRDWNLPLASTLLLSVVANFIGKVI